MRLRGSEPDWSEEDLGVGLGGLVGRGLGLLVGLREVRRVERVTWDGICGWECQPAPGLGAESGSERAGRVFMGGVRGLSWGWGQMSGGVVQEGQVAQVVQVVQENPGRVVGQAWGQEGGWILEPRTATRSWHRDGVRWSNWKGPGFVVGTRWSPGLGAES